MIGRKVERNREHGANGAGMHHQHGVARRQRRQPRPRTRDLVDKTFAAGRPAAGRRFPECVIGVAEFGGEIVVTPPGPGAKILFAKGRVVDGIEPQAARGFPRPPCQAADGKRARRQFRPERGKRCFVAEIGRRIRAMNDAAGTIDRGVPDQPEICPGIYRGSGQPRGEQH